MPLWQSNTQKVDQLRGSCDLRLVFSSLGLLCVCLWIYVCLCVGTLSFQRHHLFMKYDELLFAVWKRRRVSSLALYSSLWGSTQQKSRLNTSVSPLSKYFSFESNRVTTLTRQRKREKNRCSSIISDSETSFFAFSLSFIFSFLLTWIKHIYYFERQSIFLLCCSIVEKSFLITE